MPSFFSSSEASGRKSAVLSLRRDLAGLLGAGVRTHEAQFLDAPFADFFATDGEGRLYAVCWIDAPDFPQTLVRVLSETVHLCETRRTAAARVFDLLEDFPPPTLVLLSDRVEEDWVRVVSALSLPVILLRVHLLKDVSGSDAGHIFETRYASSSCDFRPRNDSLPGPPDSEVRIPGGWTAASAGLGNAGERGGDPRRVVEEPQPPVLQTNEPAMPEDIESSSIDGSAASEAAASAPHASGLPQRPTGNAGVGERDEEVSMGHARNPVTGARIPQGLEASGPAPIGAGAQDWSSPRSLLSEEESATFKLLETMLRSRN